jgi:hypothetical protein
MRTRKCERGTRNNVTSSAFRVPTSAFCYKPHRVQTFPLWIHNSTLCGRILETHQATQVSIHTRCTPDELTRRNIGTCEPRRGPYICSRVARGRVGTHYLDYAFATSSGECPGRTPTQTRAQAFNDPGGTSPPEQIRPVACLIHADAVPRRAVRRVGPRPDLIRSTHVGEPCGPARLLGDGSRSSRIALPSGVSANRRRREEERRE